MWSEEEMRIREELGKEVERGMEDELKDAIYQLALRLHHLYHRQNEQRNKDAGGTGKKLCSELRICISMEVDTNIEFLREIKREQVAAAANSPTPTRPNNVGFVRAKQFDWTRTRTLRSEDGAAPTDKKKKAFIC